MQITLNDSDIEFLINFTPTFIEIENKRAGMDGKEWIGHYNRIMSLLELVPVEEKFGGDCNGCAKRQVREIRAKIDQLSNLPEYREYIEKKKLYHKRKAYYDSYTRPIRKTKPYVKVITPGDKKQNRSKYKTIIIKPNAK